jgi:undecaprenyl pyrophosphate phosphatase UppP
LTPTDIGNAVSILAALSVATERLVEIIKGSIPWLNTQAKDPNQEGWRQASLHVLAAFAGIVTAWLANSVISGTIPAQWTTPGGIIVIGLLASGGSGFWNSILSYVKATKDLQEAQATAAQPAPKP